MNILQIINTKKSGKALTKEQIDFWIQGVMSGEIEDYQTSALLMAICLVGFNEDETYFLTQAIINSGTIVDLSEFYDLSVDKHSSGGVGDSTTFVVAPIFAALGFKCAKASGRGLGHTGGTLDKLESIPGFNINLDKDQFKKQIEKIGLAVISQSKDMCPADKRLYTLRDVTETVDNVGLIASSIMSKKLASGVKNIVLDVKCGRGAFMKDLNAAKRLAKEMVKIGKRANKNVVAIVTNMDYPLDEFIGNSLEVYGALNVLTGTKNNLHEVALTLAAELLKSMGVKDAYQKCEEVIDNGKALEKFKEMIAAQGGDITCLDKEYLLHANYVLDVIANKSGYVTDIEPMGIAGAVTMLGGGRLKKTDSIDLYCGVELKVQIGSAVEKGDVIAKIYSKDVNNAAILKTFESIKIEDDIPPKPQMILAIEN
ncbi:MAG: thymidine phosphorylase [Clostridia bacterium]|nr:thymidine phosphorylase [Clostridia bacterium]